MKMPKNDWEDDFLDDEEYTDFGEENSPEIPAQSAVLKFQPENPKLPAPDKHKTEIKAKNRHSRRIRVKIMPVSMKSRWPDVVSCLLTLHSGKQVMFVKGE
jgi:hypothetical protein